jgi:hypothetical protein
MTENGVVSIIALLAVLLLVLAASIQIHDAIECGNRGGTYITGKATWPTCVKGA